MRKGSKKPSNKNTPKTTIGKSSAGKKQRKLKLTIKEKELPLNGVYNINGDTYTTQENSTTTYTSVSGDELPKVYTSTDSNSIYSKVDEVKEEYIKRSRLLPKDDSNANLIVVLIGVAAFAALLLLLI